MKTNAIPSREEGARSVVFWPADSRLGLRKASTHAIQQRMSSIQAMYSSMGFEDNQNFRRSARLSRKSLGIFPFARFENRPRRFVSATLPSNRAAPDS